MSKRLTPIERAIAGEPSDRRRRYDAKMRQEGFTRVSVMVRPEDVEVVKLFVKKMRAEHRVRERLKPTPETLTEAPREGTERTERSEGAPRPRSASGGRS